MAQGPERRRHRPDQGGGGGRRRRGGGQHLLPGQAPRSPRTPRSGGSRRRWPLLPEPGGPRHARERERRGVTRSSPNRGERDRLIEFLTGEEAQRVFAEANQEYPVKPGVPWSATLLGWGEFRADELDLTRLGELNDAGRADLRPGGMEIAAPPTVVPGRPVPPWGWTAAALVVVRRSRPDADGRGGRASARRATHGNTSRDAAGRVRHNTAVLLRWPREGSRWCSGGCAWLVAMCDFPLRSFFRWALVLPLAVPRTWRPTCTPGCSRERARCSEPPGLGAGRAGRRSSTGT
jgi:hypothetical protein